MTQFDIIFIHLYLFLILYTRLPCITSCTSNRFWQHGCTPKCFSCATHISNLHWNFYSYDNSYWYHKPWTWASKILEFSMHWTSFVFSAASYARVAFEFASSKYSYNNSIISNKKIVGRELETIVDGLLSIRMVMNLSGRSFYSYISILSKMELPVDLPAQVSHNGTMWIQFGSAFFLATAHFTQGSDDKTARIKNSWGPFTFNWLTEPWFFRPFIFDSGPSTLRHLDRLIT